MCAPEMGVARNDLAIGRRDTILCANYPHALPGPIFRHVCRRIPPPQLRIPAMPTRRRFLELSAAAAGAFGLSPLIKIPLIGETDTSGLLGKRDVGRARVPLNILILGGTGFTGPEQVEYAIARGHRVTLFNRGKTRPGVFKGRVTEELI